MSNRDQKNIDLNLQFALALSQTFNNKESLEQQSLNVVKAFFSKIFKILESNEVIKKKKLKTLCNVIANLSQRATDNVPLDVFKKILQLLYFMFNKKQYTFLDKDNIAMFQELALLSVRLCVKVFQIFLKDTSLVTNKDKKKTFEDNCSLAHKILALLLVPGDHKFSEIQIKTILENFETLAGLDTLQEYFAKNDKASHNLEFFEFPMNISDALRDRNRDQLLDITRDKLITRTNDIQDLLDHVGKLVALLGANQGFTHNKKELLRLVLSMKKSGIIEQKSIELLEEAMKGLTLSEINGLVSGLAGDKPALWSDSMNNLRMTVVITENVLKLIQEKEAGSVSLMVSILAKLYQKFDIRSEDLQKLSKFYNVKAIFNTFVNTLHQIVVLSQSLPEAALNVGSPKRQESPKKQESLGNDTDSSQSSMSLEVSQAEDMLEGLQKSILLGSSKPESSNKSQLTDTRAQASGKPFLVNKEAPEGKEIKVKIEDIESLAKTFDHLLVKILQEDECASALDFIDVFGAVSTYLRALKQLENSGNQRLQSFYKERLNSLVNECFQHNIKYSSQFYVAFFDNLKLELSSSQTERDSHYPQLEYWLVVLRIILLFGLSSQAKEDLTSDKVQKFCVFLLRKILKKEASLMNLHFLVLCATFMVSVPNQKAQTLGNFYEDALQELTAAPTQKDVIHLILVLFYQFTCTRSHEFENLLREVLFFGSDVSELCKPFNTNWLLSIITLRKSFFKDIVAPEWFKEDLKAKLVGLSQTLNQKITEYFEECMSHPNVLALIIYCNYFTASVDKDNFAMLPLVKDFEALKKSIIKSSKPLEIIQTNYDVLESFDAYDMFDSYSKSQYLVQLFLKFISLNTTIPLSAQPTTLQVEPKEDELNTHTKLWEDVLSLLEKVEQRLSGGISNFLTHVLRRSEKFSQVTTQEGSQALYDFLLNIYFFSRYTYFSITPKLLTIKEEDPIASLVQCLTDVKDFEQNVEAKLEEFYKLYRAKDYNNFFLKLISFCFLPNHRLKRDSEPVQDPEMASLYALVREIVVLSVLKGEALRLFTALTRKIKGEYGKTLPDEPLNKTFVVCAEYLISNKELPIDELPQVYQLFPFETQVATRKFYFRLFIEIKKFSCLLKNLQLYSRVQSQNLVDPSQNLKLAKILRKLFIHVISNEFNNPISKVGFMLLLEMSKHNSKIADKISADFLNWTQIAANLNTLQGSELTKRLLNFAISHIRPFPGVKQIIARGVELKKNTVLPYLLDKSALSLLELFTKLFSDSGSGQDEDYVGKEGEQPSSLEGSESKTGNAAEPLSLILSKKILKKGPLNKTGKKKVESSKKKAKEAEEAKQGDDKQGLSQAQQAKVQDLSVVLYDQAIEEVFDYFGHRSNLGHFEQCISTRIMSLPYDAVELKREFENMMEVESELKYEEFYLLLAQNDFAFLLDFIELLNKVKIQDERDKGMLDRYLDILISVLNVVLKSLLHKMQKVYQTGGQALLELRNAAGLFTNTLEKFSQMLFKEKELIARPSMINETLYNFIQFICENDLRIEASSEAKSIMKSLFIEINAFITSLHASKETKDLDISHPIIETIEEETEQDESELCSFAITGPEHKTQHFYHCYTCNLVNSKGCCTVCAKKCHKGHDVIYARNTRCYCDCGDGAAPNPCKCLRKDGKAVKKPKERVGGGGGADIDLKAKNPFSASSFFSAFGGNVNQLEDILREERRLFEKSPKNRPRMYEDDEGSSSQNELEEEKLVEYSSEDEGASEEQMNLIFDSNKLKTLGSLLPQSRFSKSPNVRLASYLSGKLNNKEKDDREMKIESDDQSVSLSNIHEFLDERSIGSAQSFLSPRRSFNFNPGDVEKKLKETADQRLFNEKFSEIMTSLRNDFKGRDQDFNYIGKIVQLFNECCNTYLTGALSTEEPVEEMEEEVQPEAVVEYDFAKNLVDHKPSQSLENKLTAPNKVFTSAFDLKLRFLNDRNKMFSLLMPSNPPSRKRMDYNGKSIIAIAENDRVLFFDKKEFISTGKKPAAPSLLKPFGGSELVVAATPLDKGKAVGKFTSSHPLLSIIFNKSYPTVAALVGIENITFLTMELNGKVSDSKVLAYHNDSDFILKAAWAPGQKNIMMVVTLKGIRIYDIAQSLTTPIIIFSALEVYLKDAEISIDKQTREFRIFSTSADGQIYTQTFNLEGKSAENCDDLIMVETVMIPREIKQMNGSPSVSAHYSPISNLFFASWEDNISLIGRLQLEREPQVAPGYRLNPGENKDKAAAIFPPLGKSANMFSNFEDICADETTYYAAAIIKKGNISFDIGSSNFGLGMVMKVTKDTIHYQPILNAANSNIFRIESFLPFDFDQKGTKSHYLLCMMEDGSLQVNQVNPTEEEVPHQEPSKEATVATTSNILTEIDAMIKPQTLENSGLKSLLVSSELLDTRSKAFLVEYMEKAFALDPALLQYEEEMLKFIGIIPQALNPKYGAQPANNPVSLPIDKTPLNFSVKLKSKDHVIYGARLRLEVPNSLKIKVFNREITLINPQGEKFRFADVVLSEEEIAYVYLAEKFKFSIQPLGKKANVKIYSVEIMGQSLEYYISQLKTPKLKSLKQKLTSVSKANVPEEVAAPSLIKYSQPLPVPSLAGQEENTFKKLLDTLTMVFNTESFEINEIDKTLLEGLISNITKAIPELMEPSIKKSAKKTLKAVLKAYRTKNGVEGQTLLGYKYDYSTLKDFSAFKNFEKQLATKTQATEENLASIVNSLNRIQHKRPVQLLKMFNEFPNLLPSLCALASSLYKEKKQGAINPNGKPQIPSELNYIAEFLILNFNYQKNRALHHKYPQAENLKLSDEILDDSEIKKAGEPSIKLLLDFLFSIAKPYRSTVLKSLVKILFVESQAYTKEKQAEAVTRLEYGNDIYHGERQPKPKESPPQFEVEVEREIIPENMEVEGENLSEEEMLKLAIQMSLTQEERQREEEAQKRQEESQKIEEEIPSEANAEEDLGSFKRYVFSFYRFDISRDLFDSLFEKINGVSEHLEESGLAFKMLYKILKMQQLVSNRVQVPMDKKYVNSLAETLYERMMNIDKKSLMNVKNITAQKLLCYLNLVDVCLLSKESKKDKDPFAKVNGKQEKEKDSAIKPSSDVLQIEGRESEKPLENVALNKVISLGNEFGTSFTEFFQEKENNTGNISGWLYTALETLFEHFKSGEGTIYCTDNDNILKKNVPLEKVSKNDVEYYSQTWTPIFRKSEISKREGNLFVQLDQDIFTSIVLFACSLMSFKFKITDLTKWPELLSRLILVPPTSQLAVSLNKMLLKKVCGSKEESHRIGDMVGFEMEIREIKKVYEETDHFKKPISYDHLVTLTKSLTKIYSITQIRPKNWTEYCVKQDLEIITILHRLVLLNQDETIELAFKLLAAYYSPQEAKEVKETPQKSKETTVPVSKEAARTENLLSEKADRIKKTSSWLDITKEYIEKYIDDVLLNNYNTNIAAATLKMLISLWNVGNNAQRKEMVEKILDKLSQVSRFGHNADHLFGLLAHISKYTDWESSPNLLVYRDQIVEKLIDLLSDIKNKIISHPNHSLYSSLQEFLKDRANSGMRYYLDGEACFRCYEGLNIPFQDMRLNDLKEDFKYTSYCVLARLNNSYLINSVTVNLDERNPYRQFKSIKTVNVFINNKPGVGLIDLKNNWAEWKKLVSHTVDRKKVKEGEKLHLVINLPLPSTAKNIMLEFKTSDLTKGLAESGFMICPLCFKKFDNRFGAGRCLSCGEGVLECRKCGYLAEERVDNLFCSHCGASRYMNYDIQLGAKIGYNIEKIDSEKARETCEKGLQGSLEELNKCARDLRDTKNRIQDLISHYHRSEETQFDKGARNFHGLLPPLIQDISHCYQKNAREHFEKLMKTVGSIKSSRKVIREYILTNGTSSDDVMNLMDDTRFSEDSHRCYSCLQSTLNAYVTFFSNPTSIMGLAPHIIRREPQFINKLLDLGLSTTGVENTKKILTSVLAFLMVSIHNNNTTMLDDLIRDVEKEIDGAIESNTKSVRDMKTIHYKMLMLLSTNRSIQKIIPIKEKRNEPATLQLELWKKTTEKIEQIFRLILKHSSNNVLLSEFVLGDILRFFRNYIALAGIRSETENSPSKAAEGGDKMIMEEEKLPEKEDESIVEEDLDRDDEIKMEMPEEVREEDIKAVASAGSPFEKFGLKLIAQVLLGQSDKEFDKNSTKEKLLAEIRKRGETEPSIVNDSWLVQCLTHSSNKIAALGQSIAKELVFSKTVPLIYEIYYQSLSAIFDKEYKNEVLFKSLRDFASSNFKQGELKNPKFLRKVVNSLFVLTEKQLFKLEKTYSPYLSEASSLLIVSLNTGFEIYEVLDVVNTMLKNNDALLSSLKNDKDTLQHVLKAFLLIRKFSHIKNHYILECENLLNEMFESLKPDTDEDKKAYISECIGALLFYKNDNVCQTFLYEQILNIACPPKQKKEFQIHFAKWPTHEEFIRGQLNRIPYKASDIGTTMADVRSRICKELEIGDPNPYELLVANNLVDMDLPIYLVYEKVWVPYIRQREEEGQSFGGEIPPMKVIMRISGLDGEATENRVSGLVDDSEDEKMIEQRIKLTEVFQHQFPLPENNEIKTNGIEILLKKIKELSFITVQKPLLKKVVKLLVYCAKVQANRATIIGLKGIPILLELLLHLFPDFEPNEQDSIVENLLTILETVLRESEKDPQESMEIEQDIEAEVSGDFKNNVKNVEMCLGRLSHDAAVPAHSKLLSSLAKILPFLTGNQEEACKKLIEYFSPYLKFSTITKDPQESKDAVRDYYIGRFIEMIERLPGYFDVLRKVLVEDRLVEKIIEFIKEVNPDPKTLSLRHLEDNHKNMSYCMRILLGLINGDKNIQAMLRDSGIIELIYKLSDPKIKLKQVGKYCEDIIEYLLSSDSIVDEETQKYVKDLKQAEVAEKKRKAQQAREEALKRMGFDVKKAAAPKPSGEEESKKMEVEGEKQELQYGLRQEIKSKFATEDFEEEKVLACIVCHEGYINKPDQIIGIYTYTKKARIPDREAWLRGDLISLSANGFNTVTHFNCIHLHCHNAAAKADKQAKKPKHEWEGAIIRNSHTGCNGWFPIRGPKIVDREYEAGLMKFHQTLGISNYDQDYAWLHICDLSSLFTKFARYENFSKETKGGAAEHNLMFVPFYIQLIGYLMKQKPDRMAVYQQKLDTFMRGFNKEHPILPTASFDDFMITLAVSLLFLDTANWNQLFKLSLFYHMMSVGSNLSKIQRGSEGAGHYIKTKVVLSPAFDNKVEEEPREERMEEQRESQVDKKAERVERFFDEILPLMVGLRLGNALVDRIHAKCPKAGEEREVDKNFLFNLEQHVTNNYEQVLASCEEVNKLYKEDFPQMKYFTNFIQEIKLTDAINAEHGSVEELLKVYTE